MQANVDFVACTPSTTLLARLGLGDDGELGISTTQPSKLSQPCGCFVDEMQVSHLKVIIASIVN